jgi:hypothetical protein
MPGVLTPSTLTGTAFIDQHNVGFFQNGDPVFSGVTVTLIGTNEAGEAVNLTTTTSINGSYAFTGLLPGVYTVTIAAVPGLQNDSATPTGSHDDISLGVDQTIADLDFGLVPNHGRHQR